jgi:dinuclear metal center YbgI/SA1388 family protein
MKKIAEIISFLESLAHPSLQEHYDNAGLITGHPGWDCTGMLISLDATEEVINEAIEKKCNLVVAHHPIIFGGLKKINGNNYVERAVIAAIKKDIAIYAIHTNLDNVKDGVNGRMAKMLGLEDVNVLSPKQETLKKLFTFVPSDHAEKVRNVLFEAGAGHIGNYSECSFNATGTGTFKGMQGTHPFVGKVGERHSEEELKIEVVFPFFLEKKIMAALFAAHPYEEVAYDLVQLSNNYQDIGSGAIGRLENPVEPKAFLSHLKDIFKVPVIRHTKYGDNPIQNVAVCGGAGSFLISSALASEADIFITGDMKYHEFFDAEDRMIIADIGHYESEQFTIDLLQEVLEQKFPTFAVLKTTVNTNPVHYFL